MGVAQACAYRRRPSTESALDFSGFGHHFAISNHKMLEGAQPVNFASGVFQAKTYHRGESQLLLPLRCSRFVNRWELYCRSADLWY